MFFYIKKTHYPKNLAPIINYRSKKIQKILFENN